MAELSEAPTITAQAATDATGQIARANLKSLDFMFGAQRLLLEELVFAGNELFEQARTEIHLFTEFVSKFAGVHSVNGIREMAQECAQHQIDFLRRDSERVFKHSRRLMETGSKLLARRIDD